MKNNNLSVKFNELKKQNDINFLKEIVKGFNIEELNSFEKKEIRGLLNTFNQNEKLDLIEGFLNDTFLPNVSKKFLYNNWLNYLLESANLTKETEYNREIFSDFIFSYLNKTSLMETNKPQYIVNLLNGVEMDGANKYAALRLISEMNFNMKEANGMPELFKSMKQYFHGEDDLEISAHKIIQRCFGISDYNISEVLRNPLMKEFDTKNNNYVIFHLLRFSYWQEKLKVKGFYSQKVQDIEKERTFFSSDDETYFKFYKDFVSFLQNSADDETLKKMKKGLTKQMINVLYLGFNLETEFSNKDNLQITKNFLQFVGVDDKEPIINCLLLKREKEKQRLATDKEDDLIMQALHLNMQLDTKNIKQQNFKI